MSLLDRLSWITAPWEFAARVSDMQADIARLQLQHDLLRRDMAKNKQALAELDAQIDELEAYVLSDDETDAAEVQSRVQRLKDVLAQAKGEAPAGGDAGTETDAPAGPAAGDGTDVVNPTPGAADNPDNA